MSFTSGWGAYREIAGGDHKSDLQLYYEKKAQAEVDEDDFTKQRANGWEIDSSKIEMSDDAKEEYQRKQDKEKARIAEFEKRLADRRSEEGGYWNGGGAPNYNITNQVSIDIKGAENLSPTERRKIEEGITSGITKANQKASFIDRIRNDSRERFDQGSGRSYSGGNATDVVFE